MAGSLQIPVPALNLSPKVRRCRRPFLLDELPNFPDLAPAQPALICSHSQLRFQQFLQSCRCGERAEHWVCGLTHSTASIFYPRPTVHFTLMKTWGYGKENLGYKHLGYQDPSGKWTWCVLFLVYLRHLLMAPVVSENNLLVWEVSKREKMTASVPCLQQSRGNYLKLLAAKLGLV